MGVCRFERNNCNSEAETIVLGLASDINQQVLTSDMPVEKLAALREHINDYFLQAEQPKAIIAFKGLISAEETTAEPAPATTDATAPAGNTTNSTTE